MATASLSADAAHRHAARASRASSARPGRFPAVIYGHAREPQSLAINARELEQAARRTSPPRAPSIELDGRRRRPRKTLIREIQRHPFKRADPARRLPGAGRRREGHRRASRSCSSARPTACASSGGILDADHARARVRVDPSNIPNHIDVDVTDLTIGHSLHVSDLKVPEGVEVARRRGRDDRASCSAPKRRGRGAAAAARGRGAAGRAGAHPQGEGGRGRGRRARPTREAPIRARSSHASDDEPMKVIVGLGNPGQRVRAHASQRRLVGRRPPGRRLAF